MEYHTLNYVKRIFAAGNRQDDARLDCFSRFRDILITGSDFYYLRDELQQSCVASGISSDQCKCDIQGLTKCVYGISSFNRELRCDLFQCCQSNTGDNDEGRNDCFLQDEAQQRYDECIKSIGNFYGSIHGGSTEYCYCYKNNTLGTQMTCIVSCLAAVEIKQMIQVAGSVLAISLQVNLLLRPARLLQPRIQ